MRSEVRKEAIPLLNALRIDGWRLSAVQWENQSERIVGVIGGKPRFDDMKDVGEILLIASSKLPEHDPEIEALAIGVGRGLQHLPEVDAHVEPTAVRHFEKGSASVKRREELSLDGFR
jgi:hypothetical protein